MATTSSDIDDPLVLDHGNVGDRHTVALRLDCVKEIDVNDLAFLKRGKYRGSCLGEAFLESHIILRQRKSTFLTDPAASAAVPAVISVDNKSALLEIDGVERAYVLALFAEGADLGIPRRIASPWQCIPPRPFFQPCLR